VTCASPSSIDPGKVPQEASTAVRRLVADVVALRYSWPRMPPPPPAIAWIAALIIIAVLLFLAQLVGLPIQQSFKFVETAAGAARSFAFR
jgi:hypothetical protein